MPKYTWPASTNRQLGLLLLAFLGFSFSSANICGICDFYVALLTLDGGAQVSN
jgi:hypothetical protein